MTTRIWNFGAGPAALPLPVLEQVRDELLDWRACGMGVMEMSHRGRAFASIIAQAEASLRALLAIPEDYSVLFLQGGATQQFAQVPMNLLAPGQSADYCLTGSWSKKAFVEAQRLATVRCAGSSEAVGFTRLLKPEELDLDPHAAYLHVCTNETIHGVEMPTATPIAGVPAGLPVVADMSSHLLSRPVDVANFALIYAGAQKNIGPAGLTLVILRNDLLARIEPQRPGLPNLMNYAQMAAHGSLLNTPPSFAIYVAALVFQWLQAEGGLSAIEQNNSAKAALLYHCIDSSQGFYINSISPDCRSRMNVPFTLAKPQLDAAFLAQAEAAGLSGLKGHASFGGMRASIYNAMPLAGVRVLVDFMNQFMRQNA
ncbi:MAG: 3-phosphoserine/phosphohydroxythreonine transaminase [Pseudomonadota bacterium]